MRHSVRTAFTRAVQDWYYGILAFAALNLVWLLLTVTVVAGPPATAAMLGVARDAAAGENPDLRTYFVYLGRFFWRSWVLALLTLLGTAILVADLFVYAGALSGNPLLQNMGIVFFLYVLVVWLEVMLFAWPVLVDQPGMAIRHVLRNSAILTLRTPASNLGIALIVVFACLLVYVFPPAVILAFSAFISLLAQHHLHLQEPALANFPSFPDEEDIPPEGD
jgi:uncharacterized membrane protein YesL